MTLTVQKIDRNENVSDTDGTPRYGMTSASDVFWDRRELRQVTSRTIIERRVRGGYALSHGVTPQQMAAADPYPGRRSAASLSLAVASGGSTFGSEED